MKSLDMFRYMAQGCQIVLRIKKNGGIIDGHIE